MAVLGLTTLAISVGLWKLLRDTSFQKQYNLPVWVAAIPVFMISVGTVITALGFYILIHHGER
jgi:hypothetical protein